MNIEAQTTPEPRHIAEPIEGIATSMLTTIERLWSPSARPRFPDSPDSPDLALLKFVPHPADQSDAPNSKRVCAGSCA